MAERSSRKKKKKGTKKKEICDDSRFVLDERFFDDGEKETTGIIEDEGENDETEKEEKGKEEKEEEEEGGSDDEVGEGGGDDDEFFFETSKKRKRDSKVISMDKLKKFNAEKDRRGVIYISRVPPFMKVVKLRQLLSKYGKIDRIYLTPLQQDGKKKKRRTSSSRAQYLDGWVEFLDKRVAKEVATRLNMTEIGGSRRSHNYHDTWNLKYLSGFKWTHLTEKIAYDKAVREQQLRAELREMKHKNSMYLDNIERAKLHTHIEERKSKKAKKEHPTVEQEPNTPSKASDDGGESLLSRFPQHKTVSKPPAMMSRSLLSAAFGGGDEE